MRRKQKEDCRGANRTVQSHPMSEILKHILKTLPEGERVEEVSLYLHAAAVKSRRLGLALTFPRFTRDEPRGRTDVIANCGKLTELDARLLAEYALSRHLAEASIGVAAINSLIAPAPALIEKQGVDLLLEKAAARRLAVIGHFPFIERVRPLVKTLWVLEIDPMPGDLPASEAPRILPHADVVAITGSALINHTLEELLLLAEGKTVILMGPSTILSPVLFEFGVSALCGIQVTEEQQVQRVLREGGNFRQLTGVRYMTLMKSH